LDENDTYENVVLQHRMGNSPNYLCALKAKDSDIDYLDVKGTLKSEA